MTQKEFDALVQGDIEALTSQEPTVEVRLTVKQLEQLQWWIGTIQEVAPERTWDRIQEAQWEQARAKLEEQGVQDDEDQTKTNDLASELDGHLGEALRIVESAGE